MARGDAYADPDDDDAPGPLAFVRDHGALAARFVLAELLAPPLALRRRAVVRPRTPTKIAVPSGGPIPERALHPQNPGDPGGR